MAAPVKRKKKKRKKNLRCEDIKGHPQRSSSEVTLKGHARQGHPSRSPFKNDRETVNITRAFSPARRDGVISCVCQTARARGTAHEHITHVYAKFRWLRYGSEQPDVPALIIHCQMSSEKSERCEQVSGASEQADGQASGPVLPS